MRWCGSWVGGTVAAMVLAAGSAVAGNTGTPVGVAAATAGVWTAPPVDLGQLLDEDRRRAEARRPLRVGRPMAAGLTPLDSGAWADAPSGERYWRLTVRSAGALWLVLGFDVFDLPEGASLRVLDAAGRPLRGPLGRADRQPEGGLWLPPLPGEALTLELDWPARLAGTDPALRLATVSHGYRPVAGIGQAGAAPLASAACNVDVVCPLGAPLDDARRGVVRLLIQGSILCSGALVNNTSLDCQPYVLTANHCYDDPGSGTGNTVFLFNDDRPACGGGSPPPAQTISGASPVASSTTGDFKLMKLTQSPVQLGFDAFFNGWSRSASNPTAGWTIHHPEGDVKKIAYDAGPVVNGTTFGPQFWRVNQWDQGTTENGSSGAPLFDQNRRIVGQLRGGAATPCLAVGGFGEFGKLSVSWTAGLSAALDPGLTGVTVLDGMDGSFCGALAPQLDVSAWSTNGNVEPGAVLLLAVDARNDGPLAATGVSGVLSTSYPGVTVVDGQAAWPDIPAGQVATTAAPHFKIEVAPEAACVRAIPFQLALSSNQGGWGRSFSLGFGTDTGQSGTVFSDNMESGTNGWTTQILAGSNSWVQSNTDSLSPIKSWRIPDPASGPHDSVLVLPAGAVPGGALPAATVLRFWHHMQSETGFDGGVLELSTNGVTWQDAGPFITQGGYTGAISLGSGALAGRDAWTGDLGGWLAVKVDLGSFAGTNLRARWRFATNNLGGATAWAIDDVVLETPIYACPLFPGARCRGAQPQPGGGTHRSHICGAPRPVPAVHP